MAKKNTIIETMMLDLSRKCAGNAKHEAMCQRVRQVAQDFDYEKLAERELKIIE